jgi:glutaryl-CoA dehydrogenase
MEKDAANSLATKVVLNPVDLYDVDGLLDDDERLLASTVRQFVASDVLPVIDRHFEEHSFPAELIPTIGKLGLFGMHLDGYGCAGGSATAYGLACRELEAGDSAIRSLVSVQGSLAMFPIWKFGSEEQKQKWLPPMAKGEVIGCFGLTEHDAGSDPGSMQTNAKKDGDGWVINGTKMWITNGGIAKVAIIWAKTDEGIRGFLVETDRPGFSTNLITRKLSLRASITSELVLENVHVGNEALLPGATGLRGPLTCLDQARYGIAWGAVGAARACVEAALNYCKQRQAFGKRLSQFQLTQEKFAEMGTALTQAQLIAWRLGKLKEDDRLQPAQISLAKRANVRTAIDIARECRAMLGANGITLEYPIFRHMVNLESVMTYEGTEEIHTLALGKAITGDDAFA